MTKRMLALCLLCSAPAFAEAGLPLWELCSSPPCACGTTSCGCGEVCTQGQCRPAQQAYCSVDSQCGSGTCGAFACELNVCVPTDGGVRDGGTDGGGTCGVPDGGEHETDGGEDPAPPRGGCTAAPGLMVLGLALTMLRRGAKRSR